VIRAETADVFRAQRHLTLQSASQLIVNVQCGDDGMGLASTKSYEDLLGDGLEALLQKGINTPDGFAAGLNEANVRGPKGEKWTVDLLLAEMARLGA
jgi:hypothetical protein